MYSTTYANRLSALVLAALLSVLVSAEGFAGEAEICTPCGTDLDGSGGVDGADLGLLLGAWGACPRGTECAADLNGDGFVDGADLGLILGEWGACPAFAYPVPDDDEAHQIAMEVLGAEGPLLPPAEWVDRVARDIALIRAVRPWLAEQFHTPAFQSNFLILRRDQSVDDSSYLCLNDYYQATIWAELTLLGLTIIQFPGPINTPALAQIYLSSPHVIEAGPSGIYGGENFWFPNPFGGLEGTWIWSVDDGFHDCFDGCDCHYYYTFSVTGGGEVQVISEWSQGASWCQWPM